MRKIKYVIMLLVIILIGIGIKLIFMGKTNQINSEINLKTEVSEEKKPYAELVIGSQISK